MVQMMKQLFEELDGDHDGRVCLAELSLMLHGMQLQQPQKTSFNYDKSTCDDATEPPPMLGGDMDRFTFSIFDPNHTGYNTTTIRTQDFPIFPRLI